MKIKKVERKSKKGMGQLEVTYIDDEGNEKKAGFTEAEEALQEAKGEPVFIKRIKKVEQKEKEEKKQTQTKQDDWKRERINKFEGKEIK